MAAQTTQPRVNVRSIALPSEHGGWGFLLEPILLGLLVAGSVQGVLLALASLGVFLIHQPLKLTIKDRRSGRRPPRLIVAERFVIGYGLLAIVPMVILLLTEEWAFLVPILAAIPFALIQLYYDARNQSRHYVPEVCGAWALAMIAPAIAILGGWEVGAAAILWLILALRAGTSILYIRERLKLERNKPHDARWVLGTHIGAAGVIAVVVSQSLAPKLTLLVFIGLLGRAAWGLSRFRKPSPPKVIGFSELAYGIATVILVAIGYHFTL